MASNLQDSQRHMSEQRNNNDNKLLLESKEQEEEQKLEIVRAESAATGFGGLRINLFESLVEDHDFFNGVSPTYKAPTQS